MELNNNDNNKVRLTSLDEIGHMEKAGEGFRSKTIKETIALNNIERMVMKRRLNGEKLTLRNNDKTRYFILENGVVFKIDDNTLNLLISNFENVEKLSSARRNECLVKINSHGIERLDKTLKEKLEKLEEVSN